MKKTFKIIGYLLILIVILTALPIALPKVLGMQVYEVISGSMEPSIPVGSLVYVKEADFDELSVTDVVAFEVGASVVTHRIVDIDVDDKLFTTRGDANSTDDFMPVAYTNILGRVVFHIPLLGYVAGWLSETLGKVIAIIVLLIGVILSSVGEEKKNASTPSRQGINPKVILGIGIVIIAGSLGGFLYIYMGYAKSNALYSDLQSEYVKVSDESTQWYDLIDVDIRALQEINPDVIGWLYVEDTDISYPILYSGDDDTYLRTTIDGEYATAGSIFLEGYNLPDFSDSHNIIYGHNMRNLSMFGSLRYYKNDGYYDSHKYFQIITSEGKYRYEIFSYFDTEPGSWVYTVPYYDNEEFGAYIAQLIAHSYISSDIASDVTSSDKIVTLSTCSSSGYRFTLHAALISTSGVE